MPTKVNVSGTWRDVVKQSMNVSGTWRSLVKNFVNVSGTFRDAGGGDTDIPINSGWVGGTFSGTYRTIQNNWGGGSSGYDIMYIPINVSGKTKIKLTGYVNGSGGGGGYNGACLYLSNSSVGLSDFYNMASNGKNSTNTVQMTNIYSGLYTSTNNTHTFSNEEINLSQITNLAISGTMYLHFIVAGGGGPGQGGGGQWDVSKLSIS